MKRNGKEDDERAYEVKFGAETEFAILPSENPLEFEVLRGELAEEHAPDGPLEEDHVLTIAKCIWWKRRYQRFLSAKAFFAQFDPMHKEHRNERQALDAFYRAIDGVTDFEEIQKSLDQLPRSFSSLLLNFDCPRGNFREPSQWVEAMQKMVRKVLMPWLALGAVGIQSPVFTHEVFARELEFEDRIDRILEQTLDRLYKVKAAKRRVSFREAQGFDRNETRRFTAFTL